VYRVISIPGTRKLATITDPFSGDLVRLRRVSLELKALALNSKKAFDKSFLKPESGIQLLETSSPTTLVS